MKFQKFCRSRLNFYKTMLLTIIILSACALALYGLYDNKPIYPISYKTLGWLLAFFFPLLSVIYNIARQRVRKKEIMDAYRRDKLWDIYFPDKGECAEFVFEKHIWKRLAFHYNRFESAGFSLLAGSITFIVYFLLVKQFIVTNSGSQSWNFEGQGWAILVGSAFLGSYAGATVVALRRYRTFDLRPTVFLQISVALIAGTLSGSFITLLYPHKTLGVLAFIIGFLSAINIRFLSRLMRSTFAKLTGVSYPKDIKSDLDEVIRNTEAIESLNRISLYSVRELACADPLPLYFNMPQQINIINVMIDQAILHFYFADVADQLERAHIQRFTQLITRIGISFEKVNDKIKSEWPADVSILDAGGEKDKLLLEGVKSVVSSGHHHQMLGICHHYYREAHFKCGNEVNSSPGSI